MCCLDSISGGNELILEILLLLVAVYFSLVATIYIGLR